MSLDIAGHSLRSWRRGQRRPTNGSCVMPSKNDLVLGAGEAAEFDTRMPHWFGSTGDQAAEILSMFGPQGERAHTKARSMNKRADQN